MGKSKGKSPLRERPLRAAGESIEGQIEELLVDEVFTWTLVATVPLAVALVAWIHWITKTPPDLRFYSVVALVAFAYSLFRLRGAMTRLRRLRLGLQGERAVAELLESLRAKGAAVFHDVPGKGFNVDHVVLAKHGIYAIETKTLSKRPRASVTFDQGTVLVDGHRLDRDPLLQAQAAASWIRATLARSTGKTFPVRPVVLFPDWFVQPMKSPGAPEVWVLNPKALSKFIENDPVRLSDSDLSLATFHMDRYIRVAG